MSPSSLGASYAGKGVRHYTSLSRLQFADGVAMSEFCSQPTPSISRFCRSCGEAIPSIRLQAMPGAVECVPCLERAGDTPLLRRLDEFVGDNERVETFFFDDPRFTDLIKHTTRTVAEQWCYDIAAGDDAHQSKWDSGVAVDVGRSLASEFDTDTEPDIHITTPHNKGEFITMMNAVWASHIQAAEVAA